MIHPELDTLLNYCAAKGRVCPLAIPWNQLRELLPGRHRVGQSWAPPPPLILAAWGHTSPDDKRQRLHEHLRWALAHGALADADEPFHGHK